MIMDPYCDSSSSNDIGHNIKKYNSSTDKWIEDNDIAAVGFDIITSRFSLASEKLTKRKQNYKILLEKIRDYYKLSLKLLKRGKDKDTYRKIYHKLRKRNDFFVYEVRETGGVARRIIAEREWYKQEYDRQVGEPVPRDNEKLLRRATNGLIRQSKWIPIERICYAPPVKHVSKLEQVSWKDTPLAITCTCPGALCVCSTRNITFDPPARVPLKMRPDFFGIPLCWSMCCMKHCKPAGTLIPKLVVAVDKESKRYRSKAGRKKLKEQGPEFCMSGCLQFSAASMAVDAALAAEIAKMQGTIDVGALGTVAEEDIPIDSISAPVSNEFSRSVATQTDNDPATGDLLPGQYIGVLYGSVQDSVMNDVEGTKLQISSKLYDPPDPCAFSINKALHVKVIKQHISKIKEMYSTMSAARESYCCKDPSCRYQGLNLMASLGSILGKCKCKPIFCNDFDTEGSLKDDENVVPEEAEFICPPILEKIVDMKRDVREFLNKYFKRVEAPHPCRNRSLFDVEKDIEEKTVLETKDKEIEEESVCNVNDNQIIQEVTLEVTNIDINTPQNILQSVIDNVVEHKTMLEEIEKEILQELELKIDQKIKETGLEMADENLTEDTAFNSVDENTDSSNVTIKVDDTKSPRKNVLKPCSCMKRAESLNKLWYKAVDCSLNKSSTEESRRSSNMGSVALSSERSTDRESENFLNVIKSHPGAGDKSRVVVKETVNNEVENNDNLITEIHKSSIMKMNYKEDIKTTPKSSTVKCKPSCIGKLGSNSRTASSSGDIASSGVLTMISRKVSNSGWRGWFSFIKETDKDTTESDDKNSKNIRLPGKVESRKSAIKKYEEIAKSLSDDQSYYTDEVLQNVESLRNLNSSQTTGKDSNKTYTEEKNEMPKHYRFYY